MATHSTHSNATSRTSTRAPAGPVAAAGHAHVNRKGEALVSAAEAALVAAGEQWTPMRASVFAALAGFDRPVSAYDVTDAVSQSEGRRVAANSVYRILDLFVARNVAMRVESCNAYVANAHPDCMHDCIFLVCDNCGRATHVDDDQLGGMLRARAAERGFLPAKSVMEMRGQCAACADAGAGVGAGVGAGANPGAGAA